jgi:hypothetical protein
MFTSFAPSPMARVVAVFTFYLTIETTSAFYLGLTLHAITTLAFKANSRNSSYTLEFLVIFIKDSPDTITALSLASSVNF